MTPYAGRCCGASLRAVGTRVGLAAVGPGGLAIGDREVTLSVVSVGAVEHLPGKQKLKPDTNRGSGAGDGDRTHGLAWRQPSQAVRMLRAGAATLTLNAKGGIPTVR